MQRTCAITLINNTSFVINLSSSELPHGNWLEAGPPQTVPAGGTATFQAQPKDELSGVQGCLEYQIGAEGTAVFSFDNPFDAEPNCYGLAPAGYEINSVAAPPSPQPSMSEFAADFFLPYMTFTYTIT